MIGLDAALVSQFSRVLYIFGAFLVISGIKMWMTAEHTPDIENNRLLTFCGGICESRKDCMAMRA